MNSVIKHSSLVFLGITIRINIAMLWSLDYTPRLENIITAIVFILLIVVLDRKTR